MRLTRKRALQTTTVNGKERPKVGPFQMKVLKLVDKYGGTREPPPGTFTATGEIREHILHSLIPLKLVSVDVHEGGVADYHLTRRGRFVMKNGITSKPPNKRQRSRLIDKQRGRAKKGANNHSRDVHAAA